MRDLDEETAKWEREFEEQRARRVALRERARSDQGQGQGHGHGQSDAERLKAERSAFESQRDKDLAQRTAEELARREAAQREAQELNEAREREREKEKERQREREKEAATTVTSTTSSVRQGIEERRRVREAEEQRLRDEMDQRTKEREAKRKAREEERRRQDLETMSSKVTRNTASHTVTESAKVTSSTSTSTSTSTDKATTSPQPTPTTATSSSTPPTPTPTSNPSKPTSTPSPSSSSSSSSSDSKVFMRSDQAHPMAAQGGSKWYTRLSTLDRPFPSVPVPESRVLDERDLVLPQAQGQAQGEDEYDLSLLARHLAAQGRVTPSFVLRVVAKATALLHKEPNVLELRAPCVIVGDVHGQYFDLLELFRVAGALTSQQYVFLGDYVDRGFFSLETLLLLLCAKVNTPERVALLRGNHETRAMNAMHSFQAEVQSKLSSEPNAYAALAALFDSLPLCARVHCAGLGYVLCVHGGISQSAPTLADLLAIERFQEPEDDSAMMDLLWADPLPEDSPNQLWKENAKRGCGLQFGHDALSDFLEANALAMVVRAHQVQQDGYKELWYKKWNPEARTPKLVTLFSAPNYCDKYGNTAAVMLLSDQDYMYKTFAWQDHPYVMPTFKSAFAFSLPFVAENVMKFLLGIMQLLHGVELDEERLAESEAESEAEAARRKHKALGTLRQAARAMLQLKQMREANEELIAPLKLSVLSQTHQALRRAHSTSLTAGSGITTTAATRKDWFQAVLQDDERNERLERDDKNDNKKDKSAKAMPMRRTRSFKF